MSNFEVAAELTWENGQLAMHEFPSKPTWGGTEDTLESIVHQATICNNQSPNLLMQQQRQKKETIGSVVASSGDKRTEKSTQGERLLPGRKVTNSLHEHKGDDGRTDRSACGSATANVAFGKDHDPIMMTWASFKSPTRTKTTKTTDEDSACHGGSENLEEERETRGESETGGLRSGRRGRTAAVHNQSERRRRDRINQKMKTLQKLVPNACKTDKASMLDEVIDYLKELQAQVQMFSGYMPHLMMPLGVQQQVQMSLLARMRMGAGMGVGMGMGMGMGMLHMRSIACAAAPQPMTTLTPPSSAPTSTNSPFMPPLPLAVASLIPNITPTTQIRNNGYNGSVSVPSQYPYNVPLAQSLNVDHYNRMVAFQR